MTPILALLLASAAAGACPADPEPAVGAVNNALPQAALAGELASCELDPAKASRIFQLARSVGHLEAGSDGLGVVFIHGYPEAVSLSTSGHPEGLAIDFNPLGLPISSRCFQGGVQRELTFWSKGAKARAERWDAQGRRTENVYWDVWGYGYSEAIEHYAPGGHMSWTEAWSKYTGDHLTWIGSLFDRRR